MRHGQGHGQVCALALACEILAERWTLLVLREVLLGGRRFSEIQRGIPRISPTMLTRRLAELSRDGLIRREADGYRATAAGLALRPLLFGLADWGRRYARHRLDLRSVDPALLLWEIRRYTVVRALPPRRVVVAFRLEGAPANARNFWLVADRGEVELCLLHPGSEVDLTVVASVRTLALVWMGELDLAEAVRTGRIALHGARQLARSFPRWFGVSPAARRERAG